MHAKFFSFWALTLSVFVLTGSVHAAGDDSLTTTLDEAGLRGGLVVAVGAEPGSALGPAKSGRYLVQLLDADPSKAQKAIDAAAVRGLATARSYDGGRLPYGDNMVSALVLADVSKVADTEIKRVLSPGRGVLVTGKPGAWTVARPVSLDGYGEWPQLWYDAARNPVSPDKFLAPVDSIQWLAGQQANTSRTFNGFRLADGIATYTWNYEPPRNRWGGGELISARDAWNGVALWNDRQPDLMTDKGPPFLIAEGLLIAPAKSGYLQARDLKTGKVLHTYKDGLKLIEGVERKATKGGSWRTRKGRNDLDMDLIYHEGRLYQTNLNGLVVLELKSGKKIWSAETGDKKLFFWAPTVMASEDLLVVAVGDSVPFPERTPLINAKEIRAYDLATGKLKWTNDEYRDKRVSQILTDGERLVVFNRLRAKPDGPSHWMRLDPKTGKTLWAHDMVETRGNMGKMREAMIIGDKMFGVSGNALSINLKTGQHEGIFVKGMGPGQCDTTRATKKFILGAGINYINVETKELSQQTIGRASCSTGGYPAYGMAFYPPTACNCTNFIRYWSVLAPRGKHQPMPDDQRLTTGPAQAPAAAGEPNDDAWPVMLGNAARSGRAGTTLGRQLKPLWKASVVDAKFDGAIPEDWLANSDDNGRVTGAVVADGVAVVALPYEHRLVALDTKTGQEKWRATLDGRTDVPPVLWGGMAIAADRSGRITAYRLDDGARVWSYFAATNHEQMVAFSQLESRWPIGAPLVVDGKLVALVGRHPQADGGMKVIVLDARTGKPEWIEPITLKYGGRSEVRQAPLRQAGDIIYTEGLEIDLKNKSITEARPPGKQGRHKTFTPLRIDYRGILPNNNRLMDAYGGTGMGKGAHNAAWVIPADGRGNLEADQVAWDDEGVFALRRYHALGYNPIKDIYDESMKRVKPKYEIKDLHCLAGLALTKDKIIVAQSEWRDHYKDDKPGTVRLYDRNDPGKLIAQEKLPSAPVWAGVAVADSMVFVSLRNGEIHAFSTSSK